MPEWDAEIHVDEALVRALLDDQFPELPVAEVVRLAEGWDNAVWLVDGRWAFRFPRRAIAVPLLEHEVAVLERIGSALPLPVPKPEFVGRPGAGYPWPFVGAVLLPGVELAESRLPDEARVPAARAIGAFLRTLHQLDPADAVRASLPIDPNRRADMGYRALLAGERLSELGRRGLWSSSGRETTLLAAALALPAAPDGPLALAHGDLHVRHVLVDGAGAATGVIDWGDVCLADPAVDLSIAFSAFRGGARHAFWEAYGPASDDQQLRARVLALFLSATLLLYADDIELAGLQDEARDGLARAVEP